MKSVKWMTTAAILAALAGCGAEEIESPGNSGNVTINNPPAPPANPRRHRRRRPPPWSRRPPAARRSRIRPACAMRGTITGPTGTYRVCELPARFTANTTLEKFPGLLYSIDGRVDVGLDRGAAPTADAAVSSTIRPGVVLYGATGTSWLAVNRGNRIKRWARPTRPSSSRAATTCSGLVDRRLAGPVGRRRAARSRTDHGLHGRAGRDAGLGQLRAPDRRRR